MSDLLADTDSAVWALYDTGKLSPAAAHEIQTALQAGRFITLINDPAERLDVLPVTADVAQAVGQVLRAEVPDTPGRIIAATAIAHSLPLVSADSDIRGSASLAAHVRVIW